MVHKRRSLLYLPFLIALCSLLGGLYGPRVEVASAANEDDIRSSLKVFTKVYNTVEETFADPLNPDKAVYKGAIPGMLRTLDPHSNFFDPRDFQLLREDQKGHYYGVGMTVAPRNGKTIVIAPFTGSPAYKAGIRPGDVIMTVNDKSTDNLNTTEVADLLKGPRGTQVQILIAREGSEKPITFNVVRDEISRKSVQDAIWLKPGIAYMDIESFNETTSPEVEENLKRLGEKNIKGLVLDLRENPGGLLNEGVAVADRFLRKGQVIVSPPRPQFIGEILRRAPWERQFQLPHRRPGEPLSRRLLPRSSPVRCRTMTGLGYSVKTPSAKAWCKPCIRCRRTPAWL